MASESPNDVRPERAVALVGGRYRLDGVLGRGGFGVVHRATDELLQRVVAVKEVRLPISGSADERDRARERVLREARAAGRLQHPGAVSVLDVIDDGDLPWIIMEFVEGRALSRIITGQGPRPVDETCRIGISLAYALEAAHRLGIVHRDVKPSNVLITPDGRARLTDFGIAVSHGDPRLTSTGMVLGSPAYLPPERARGDAGGAGGDRWALGATLFTTVEGSPPFGGGDPIAVLGALMRGQRQPFRLAGPLAPLLDDLMAPQSTSRPPLSLVRRRLREILDHSGDHRSFRSGASTRGSRSERPQRAPAAPLPPTSPEVTPSPAAPEKVAPVAALTTPTVAVHALRETTVTPTTRADSAVLSPTDWPPADGADSPSPALAALPEKPSAAAEAATRGSQPESLVTNDLDTAHTPPEPTEISTSHNADDKRLSSEQRGAPVVTPPQSSEVTAVTKTAEVHTGSGGGESPERAGSASTIASVALVEAAVIGATATLATAAALRVVGAGTTSAAAAAEQPTEALPTGGSQSPERDASAAHLDRMPLDQATRSTPGAAVEAGPAATTPDPDGADADAENIDPELPTPDGSDRAPAAAVRAEPARAGADQPEPDQAEPDQAEPARPTPAGQAARPRPTGPLERIRHADRMRALGGIPARARLVRRGPGSAPPAGPAAPPADVVPARVVPTSSEPAASAPAAAPRPPSSASVGAGATPDGPPALAMRSRLGQNWPRLRPPTATNSSPPPLAFRPAASPSAAPPPAASGPDTFPPATPTPATLPTRAPEAAPPRPRLRPAGTESPFTPAPPRDAAAGEAVPAAAEGRGATPPPGDGSPRRWRRIAVASVIGTLVAAAVIILLVVLSRPGSDTGPVGAASAGRDAAPASGPNAPPPGGRAAGEQDASRSVDPAIVPAVPVAHDTTPAPAPPGWSSYADPDAGWSVAYPTGWRRQPGPGGPGNVDFMDPVSGSFLRVGSVRQANTSAIVDWQRNEAGFDRSVQDYRRVRLASSDGGDGTDQADWEFTYRRSDGVMVHVLNRGAIRNGHGYALYWHTREDLWLQDQPLLRQLFETFRPGP